MATADEVDDVALALFGRSDLTADAEAFRVAWEAWRIWANGGFEAALTGGLANDAEVVVAALRRVGANEEADLFGRAFHLVAGDIDARNDQWIASAGVRRAAKHLDEAMAALPPLVGAVLGPLLDARPDLRARSA